MATTHGHTRNGIRSKTFTSWYGMIERCHPEKQYGKLGITVCERWLVFANFLADMCERPPGHELDRKDPLGNYNKDNCQWRLVRPNRQYRRTTLLTEEKRAEIQRLRKQGKTHRAIAAELGVSKSCITDYLTGSSWG